MEHHELLGQVGGVCAVGQEGQGDEVPAVRHIVEGSSGDAGNLVVASVNCGGGGAARDDVPQVNYHGAGGNICVAGNQSGRTILIGDIDGMSHLIVSEVRAPLTQDIVAGGVNGVSPHLAGRHVQVLIVSSGEVNVLNGAVRKGYGGIAGAVHDAAVVIAHHIQIVVGGHLLGDIQDVTIGIGVHSHGLTHIGPVQRGMAIVAVVLPIGVVVDVGSHIGGAADDVGLFHTGNCAVIDLGESSSGHRRQGDIGVAGVLDISYQVVHCQSISGHQVRGLDRNTGHVAFGQRSEVVGVADDGIGASVILIGNPRHRGHGVLGEDDGLGLAAVVVVHKVHLQAVDDLNIGLGALIVIF